MHSLLGFMFGTNVFDKDGISAAVVMAEMASYLNRQGRTLTEQLHKLYQRFGVLHNSCIDWYTNLKWPVRLELVSSFICMRQLGISLYPPG